MRLLTATSLLLDRLILRKVTKRLMLYTIFIMPILIAVRAKPMTREFMQRLICKESRHRWWEEWWRHLYFHCSLFLQFIWFGNADLLVANPLCKFIILEGDWPDWRSLISSRFFAPYSTTLGGWKNFATSLNWFTLRFSASDCQVRFSSGA